jgi:glycosyltransferase involved in cell wall biosynthesis
MVRGLLGQAYPPDRFEIIVVDNGSADETIAIFDRYSSRIRLVRDLRGRVGKVTRVDGRTFPSPPATDGM